MESFLETILALCIVSTSIAFGGVQLGAYSLLEVVLFFCILLLLIRQTLRGNVNITLPIWPALFVFWILLEFIPMPPPLILRLSPMRASDLEWAVPPANQASWTTLSIYPHESEVALVKFLALLTAFVLAAQVFASRRRNSLLVRALIFLGFFEAAYGIVQHLTGWQKVLTYSKQWDLGAATGTYINHNHFAGLLELILPFVVAAIFYAYQLWSEGRHSGMNQNGGVSPGFRVIFYFFLLVLMFVALIFSTSRAGILTAVFSVVFIAVLAQVRTRQKVWALGAFFFLMCVFGYGLWIGFGPILERFERFHQTGYLQMEGRLSMWKDSLRLIRSYPLTGTGLGTFAVAYRPYQTGSLNNYVDHAHDDYLEFASETGLPGAALLFLPIVYLLGRMIASFLDDPRRYRRAVTLGCIGSTLALLIHSVTDFNLQIPANALIFAAVLGIGYKAVCIERPREDATPPPSRP